MDRGPWCATAPGVAKSQTQPMRQQGMAHDTLGIKDCGKGPDYLVCSITNDSLTHSFLIYSFNHLFYNHD